MGLWWEIQNRIKNASWWLICGIAVFYFAFHTVNGERGLLKYLYLRQEILQAQKVAAEYSQQKHDLEVKVRHLSNGSLDLDLLEERARIVLNLADNDDFIILDEE
ncbi:MAG: septum formation initiator family protein [Alphaproteobacteria bacterium]|nr:septum formation initiator family protein [Alphaproteobacteria bacterium]